MLTLSLFILGFILGYLVCSIRVGIALTRTYKRMEKVTDELRASVERLKARRG